MTTRGTRMRAAITLLLLALILNLTNANATGAPTNNAATPDESHSAGQQHHVVSKPMLATHQARWHHPAPSLLGRKGEGPSESSIEAEQSAAVDLKKRLQERFGWGVPKYDKQSRGEKTNSNEAAEGKQRDKGAADRSLDALDSSGLLGNHTEAPTFGSCRACCYGCKVNQGGFGCEQRCRICCPQGQAAVCDNSPSCKCEGAQQQQQPAAVSATKQAISSSSKKMAELHAQVKHMSKNKKGQLKSGE